MGAKRRYWLPAVLVGAVLLVSSNPARVESHALPDPIDHIGLYASPDATGCDLALGAGESATLEILVVLPNLGDGGLTALEFRVAGLPENGAGGVYTAQWNTELVIGDVASGIALAFSDPLYGPVISIGRISFQAQADGWLGADRRLQVTETLGSHKLVFVDDQYHERFVPGSTFTFNCSEAGACPCGEYYYPGCLVVPPALDFGFVLFGDSIERSFRFVNYTPRPLEGVVTEYCVGFHITAGGDEYLLQPGESRLVTVQYWPVDLGQHSCIVDLGTEACSEVLCTGYSLPPETTCEVSPDTLDFGVVEIGFPQTRNFTITNTGTEILVVDLWEDCPHFGFTWGEDPGVMGVQPGHWLTVPVEFDPTAVGDFDCVLHTSLGDENNCGPVYCRGTAIVHELNCSVTPSRLDFGEVAPGSFVERPFTIRNLGTAPLSGYVGISGQGFSLVAGAGSFTLQPGGQREGIARFTYVCPGDYAGILTTGLLDCTNIPCSAEGLPRGARTYVSLGLYAQPDASTCFADLPLHTPTVVYLTAHLSPDLYGLRSAHLRVSNLPNAACVDITPVWTTWYVTGDLATGITLSYPDLAPGPDVRLGALEFYLLDPNCIGDDYIMEVLDATIVDDCFDSYHPAEQHFTFNCTWGYCPCYWTTPVSLSQFTLEDLGAAARLRWESEGATSEEFRLDAVLAGDAWTVPYTQLTAASYEAIDHSPRLAAGGRVSYALHGRVAGEDWTLLRSETLAVSPARLVTCLRAPHPNPFNPAVTIPFALASPGPLTIAVYDVAGRRLALLADGPAAAGEQAILWRGRDDAGRPLSSGVYFVEMRAHGFSAREKLVLLR